MSGLKIAVEIDQKTLTNKDFFSCKWSLGFCRKVFIKVEFPLFPVQLCCQRVEGFR